MRDLDKKATREKRNLTADEQQKVGRLAT